MANWIEKIFEKFSSLQYAVLIILMLEKTQDLYANLTRISLNTPGLQSTVAYTPWDTIRIVTNESWITDSLNFIPTDGLIANYRFTQELLSTLSIVGKITTLVIKMEKTSPVWSIPNHTILYDPANGWELYRKLFPLPSWNVVSTNGSLNSSSVPSQTRYGIIRKINIPLPVELTSFQGSLDLEWYPLLTWSTASEKDNKEFVIERSKDGIFFDYVATMSWSWYSSTPKDYEFIDHNVYNQYWWYIYYRLWQIDFSGKREDSPIISLKIPFSLHTASPGYLISGWQIDIPWLIEYQLYSLDWQLIQAWTGPMVGLSGLSIGQYILVDIYKNSSIKLLLY